MINPEKIKEALKNELPGVSAHKKMLPKGREIEIKPEKRNSVKRSSVLLLLYEQKNELHICLIERPAHMHHHANQIALPGGRMEKGETAIETALREANEEVGIEADDVTILGKLSEIYISVSNFIITPIVAWSSNVPTFIINPDEVSEVISFPILQYKDIIESEHLETLTGIMKVPCIHYDCKVIWGATAMILSEFYDVVDQIIQE